MVTCFRIANIATFSLLALGAVACGSSGSEEQTRADGTPRSGNGPQLEGIVAVINSIDSGDRAELKGLLESGIQPTPPGAPLSTLHAAITHFGDGRFECDAGAVELLLVHGADANFLDPGSNFLPLEEALAMGSVRCAELLRDAGARIDQMGPRGQSMLDYAVKGAMKNQDATILRLALSWGIDPNVLGAPGSSGQRWTALFETTSPANGRGGVRVAQELLRAGTNPCYRDEDGVSALDEALRYGGGSDLVDLLRGEMRKCP
jgi:hypothetical protein